MAAWLRKGEVIGHETECRPYDKQRFIKVLKDVRSLTVEPPEGFQPEVKRLCAQAGVAVAFVPEFPKTRVSGATRWLTPQKALVMLSLRYKTDDQLWFTLFHEVAHILSHGKTELFIHDTIPNANPKEAEADKFAADFLIPPDKYQSFLQTHGSNLGKKVIRDFAGNLKIAPGIVVGRLHHDGNLPFSHCNDLKVRLTWKEQE